MLFTTGYFLDIFKYKAYIHIMSIQDHTLGELLRMASYDNLKKTYKQNPGEGKKVGGKFNQNQKEEIIRPITKVNLKNPEEPAEDNSKLLAEQARLQAERDKKKVEEPPKLDPELFKDDPPLTVGLAVVKINKSKEDIQRIEGAEQVEEVYAIKSSNKLIRKAGEVASTMVLPIGKVAANVLLVNPATMISHPVETLQKMFLRAPLEKAKIAFAGEIDRRLRAVFFKDATEIPLVVPEDFIKLALDEGKKVRDKKKFSSNLKDLGPSAWGAGFDTQQKRAIEWLIEELKKTPDQWPDEIKAIRAQSLESATKLARGFSLTVTNGDNQITDQKKYDSSILRVNEKRNQLDFENPQGMNSRIQDAVKKELEPFLANALPLTPDEEVALMKKVFEIYKDEKALTPEEIKDKKLSTDIIGLLAELRKDEPTRLFYANKNNWAKFNIVCYKGESNGDTRGGERKLTWNQQIALKVEDLKDQKQKIILRGGVHSVGATLLDTTKYLSGYVASFTLGAIRGDVTRSVFGAVPPLGPIFSAFYGGSVEAGRTKAHERKVSRENAFGRIGNENDHIRKDMEKALVTAVAATELTDNINKLILADATDFSSETKKDITKEQVLELLTHMGHAKARLDLTQRSGGKEMGGLTQNWVSYHEGQDQGELTNLKAASLQSMVRLERLFGEKPELFVGLPLFDGKVDDLSKTVESYAKIISLGLQEGLPAKLLNGNSPLATPKGQKFYRQIFEASGVPRDKVNELDLFINSLTIESTIGAHKMSEWMMMEESAKRKESIFKAVRRDRVIIAAGTSFGTSAAMAGFAKVVTSEAFSEHVVRPVVDKVEHTLNIPHQHPVAPVAPASPEPNQFTPEQKITIDLPNIFKEPTNEVVNIFKIFNENTGKIAEVRIPIADGYRLFDADNDGNYDIVKISDGSKLYNDVFILDKAHGALIPNPHFVPDSSHPGIEVNLEKIIDFKTEQQVGISQEKGEPISLGKMIDDYRLVWGHSKEVIPDKDYIFETPKDAPGHDAHPYGIEIKFAENTVRDPNTGAITTLQSHYQDGSMAAALNIRDYFGPGKDGQLLLNDCIERLPDGSYSFKLDPTSDKVLSFADGTKVTMAQVAQILLNEKELLKPENHRVGFPDDTEYHGKDIVLNGKGYWMFGYIEEAPKTAASAGGLSGHNVVPGGSETDFFQPVYYMGAGGDLDNSATITPPGEPILTTTTTLVTPRPVEVTIPGDPIPPVDVPPVQPTSAGSTDYQFPGVTVHPEIQTTTKSAPPANSSPLPQSVINQQNAVKEEPLKKQQDKNEAIQFIENQLSRNISEEDRIKQTNALVLDQFTQTQRKILEDSVEQVRYTGVINNHTGDDVKNKLKHDSPDLMTQRDKSRIVNALVNSGNYNERQASVIAEYLTQINYYDATYGAIRERNEINRQLEEINRQLASSTPIPPRPNPPTEEIGKKSEMIDSFTTEIAKKISSEEGMSSEQLQEIQDFIFEELLNPDQREIMEKMSSGSLEEVKKAIAQNEQLNNKMKNSIPFDEKDDDLAKEIIEKTLGKRQADAYYESILYLNTIISQIDEKMEAQKVDDEQPHIEIAEPVEDEDDGIPPWLKQGWDDLGRDHDPDHAIATGLHFDDSKEDENGGGELRKSFEEHIELTKQISEINQRRENREKELAQQGKDEFGFLSDHEWMAITSELENAKAQIGEIESMLSHFEINKLPIILGGTFDLIVANPHDERQDVHSFYYHGFRDAFRQYMADYVSRGRDADNAEIRMAFNKLKGDLHDIDPSVNLVRFEEFMDKIRASV